MAIKGRGMTAKATIVDCRNKPLGWSKAIGELIDNAVGNGAKTVSVMFRPHYVRVVDDGVGCTDEMFEALISFGWHVDDPKTNNKVSRFGVGAKQAAVWFGGPTEFYSRRDGEAKYIEIDWDDFAEEWDYPEALIGERGEAECKRIKLPETGTAVIAAHHDRQLTEKQFQDVRGTLNDLFWAAVETGVVIRLEFKRDGKNGSIVGGLLDGKTMPRFDESRTINKAVELAGGRRVHVNGGVLASDERITRPGFEYIYGHRVVVQAGGLGSGGFDFERVYFRVTLLGDKESWRVTTNKCGLHDADQAALEQAVFGACKSLLQAAKSEDYAQRIDQDLLDEISDELTTSHRKKAKRKPVSNPGSGAVAPTGKGSQHRKAKESQDGDDDREQPAKQMRGKIRIVRAEFADESVHLVADAVVKDRIVRLNRRHPFISTILGERDKRAILLLVDAVWSEAWLATDDSGQSRLISRGAYVDKLSAMLNQDSLSPTVSQGTEA